ncbi:MAG: hypothetical protein JKY52_08370 [Flavobacteriales bacterium]|nr:hypothetical protein [Flavobacteriales bacterium]
MPYFQDEASIRYITHTDDNTDDDDGKLSGNVGTVSASFQGDGADVLIWGTDGATLSLTISQMRHLASVFMEVERIHASNQKVK